jgi:hypothetical protein
MSKRDEQPSGGYLEVPSENRHIEPMTEAQKPLSVEEAVSPRDS